MHLTVVVAFSTRLNCILDIISVQKGVGLISCNFHLIFHFRVILNRLARFTWKLSCNGQLKRSRPRPFGSSKKKMGVSPSNSVVVRWSDASTKSTLTNSWPLFSVSPPSVHIAVTLFGAWANRAISAKFAYVWSTSAVTSSSRQSVLESKNWQSLTM